MLPRLHGMFAFVIWDRVARRGFVARDPYGIKPLYVATTAQGTLIASQVKALMATGLVSREPDLHGQAGFWMLGSVPEPHTWYRDVRALPAGHCAWIEDGRIARVPLLAGHRRGVAVNCASSHYPTRKFARACRVPCANPWPGTSSPTCRLACSCPAASTPARWPG